MKGFLLKDAGAALTWRAVQLGGVKIIFFGRLLILARLLSPEDFGLLAIAGTAIGFLMQMTNLGMIPAVVQSKEVNERQYNTAWTIGVSRALLVTLGVIVTAPIIADLFNEPRAIPIIQVLALRPLLEALASIKVADLTRQLKFRPLAGLKLSEAVINTVITIILAQSLGVWALVIGNISGSVAYLLLSYILAPHRLRFAFDRQTTRQLIRFGRWIFVSGLISMAGGHVLRLVVSRQLGVAELGLYFLAAQLAFLPAELASEVIGEVAFPLFARLQNDLQRMTRVFRALVVGITALLFPVCILIAALAPSLVQYILGAQWEGTIDVIRLLSIATMIGLFGEVAGPIFNGLGQPYRVTAIEVMQSLLLILFVWFLTGRYGLIGTAVAWIPAIANSQLISVIFLRRLLPQPLKDLAGPMLAIVATTGLGAVVALLVQSSLPTFWGFVLAGLAAVSVIGAGLLVFERRFKLGLIDDILLVFPRAAGFFSRVQPEI